MMASSLYTKTWKDKDYLGKSRRVLLTPDFANFVLAGKDDLNKLAGKYGKPLRNIPLSYLRVVFVPVLDIMDHWWCVSFDLKAEMIRVIDLMYSNLIEEHVVPISQLPIMWSYHVELHKNMRVGL